MTYSATVLADSPLAYWRLGDASGTTATDSSGNARGIVYANSPTLGVAGLVSGDSDTAVSFNGSNWLYGAYGAWMSVASITLETLIQPTSLAAQSILMNRVDTPLWEFSLNPNVLQFKFWTTTGGPFTVVGSTTVATGAIHHVAATYDGTTAKVLLDGVVDGSLTQSGSLKTNTDNLYCATNSGGGNKFNGVLDEMAYYGSALTTTRLAAHASAAGIGGGGGGGGTPRGVYRLPEPFRRQAVIRAAHY